MWNFLPNNFLRFVILQNLCYTVLKRVIERGLSKRALNTNQGENFNMTPVSIIAKSNTATIVPADPIENFV